MPALARAVFDGDDEALMRVSSELSALGERATELQALLSPLILSGPGEDAGAMQRTLFAFQELDLMTQTLFALSHHVTRLANGDMGEGKSGLAKLEARLAGRTLEVEDTGFELF